MRQSSTKPTWVTSLDVQALADYARQADLEFVALFGSQASGRATPHSDLDLALMPVRSDQDPEQVEPGLVAALGRGDLDLVWLPHANWLLSWKVAEGGQVLYERTPGGFRRYQVRSAWRHADARIWHERNREFLQRSLQRRWTLDTELVTSKLASMVRYLHELEQWLGSSQSDFEADLKTQRAAERQIELLIEAACTVNAEIAQAVARIPPSDYYSSFFSVATAGWLDRELAGRLANLVGLRNRLVHQYEDVETPKLYRAARASLRDWQTYLDSITGRLG